MLWQKRRWRIRSLNLMLIFNADEGCIVVSWFVVPTTGVGAVITEGSSFTAFI